MCIVFLDGNLHVLPKDPNGLVPLENLATLQHYWLVNADFTTDSNATEM